MTNDAMRIFKLEQSLAKAMQLIAALQQQVGQLNQNQVAAAGGFGGGGGGAGGAFVAEAISNIPPMGTPNDGATPSSGPGTVYQIISGSLSIVGTVGGTTLLNAMPDIALAEYTLIVEPVGDGTYLIQAMSCEVAT